LLLEPWDRSRTIKLKIWVSIAGWILLYEPKTAFTSKVQASNRKTAAEFQERQKSRRGNASIQRDFYNIYRDHVNPFVADDYLARRLARWANEWDYFPDSRTLSTRALAMLRCTYKRPMPCIVTAVLKTLLNAWVTARRFQDVEARHCKLGCADGDDCIEHYAVCPAVYAAWEDFCGLPSPSGPLGFLCLASESNHVMKLRMAFLFCIHSVILRLQATSDVASAHSLILQIRERRRFIAGESVEVRSALRETRLHCL
jgi:hypothetical protein